MRLVGERKACAVVALAFYGLVFALNALLGPPGLGPMFGALAFSYLVGVFGLVAGWFWARWYSMGLGISGLFMAGLLVLQIGLDGLVMVWAGGHGVVLLSLLGRGPSAAFDARRDWRERFRMDDNAAGRLGKAIMRAGASVPYLILAGLAPRNGTVAETMGIVAVLLGGAGVFALVRLRTWGLFSLALSAMCCIGLGTYVAWTGLASAFLLGSVAPFVRPMIRSVREQH